jgi:pyruvate/2-oxoglutarate dehydrogenase complex dihydrolipoamide acyltransferase (E2) component
MPKIADTSDEVIIVGWYVAPSDTVQEGAPLLEVETDKAHADVPSPMSGVVIELLVQIDDEVTTSTPIAILEV